MSGYYFLKNILLKFKFILSIKTSSYFCIKYKAVFVIKPSLANPFNAQMTLRFLSDAPVQVCFVVRVRRVLFVHWSPVISYQLPVAVCFQITDS